MAQTYFLDSLRSIARCGIAVIKLVLTLTENLALGKLMGSKNKKPFLMRSEYFACIFLALIPVFALIYYLIGDNQFKSDSCDYFTFLYFSLVTITTLGYGDIYPVSGLAKLLVSLEVILGILCAGLFLNACSLAVSKHVSDAEKHEVNDALARKEFHYSRRSILESSGLLDQRVSAYLIRCWSLFTPLEERSKYSECEVVNESGELLFSPAFKSLNSIFQPSLLISDGAMVSTVEVFFKYQDKLLEAAEDVMRSAPLYDWEDLRSAIRKYVEISRVLDFRIPILEAPKRTLGEGKMSDFALKLIDSHEGEVSFEPVSNLKNDYVALYLLAQAGLKFSANYRRSIIYVKNCTFEEWSSKRKPPQEA